MGSTPAYLADGPGLVDGGEEFVPDVGDARIGIVPDLRRDYGTVLAGYISVPARSTEARGQEKERENRQNGQAPIRFCFYKEIIYHVCAGSLFRIEIGTSVQRVVLPSSRRLPESCQKDTPRGKLYGCILMVGQHGSSGYRSPVFHAERWIGNRFSLADGTSARRLETVPLPEPEPAHPAFGRHLRQPAPLGMKALLEVFKVACDLLFRLSHGGGDFLCCKRTFLQKGSDLLPHRIHGSTPECTAPYHFRAHLHYDEKS